jgi:hypothetical protein
MLAIAIFLVFDLLTGLDVSLPLVAAAPPLSGDRTAPEGNGLTYRYSVIPGGAYSSDELRDALAADAIAADHHRGVVLDLVRVEQTTVPRLVYVSYRIGDEIAWTKHPVLLPAGERILSDGVSEIRARCGNGVSDEPRQPTSDQEPHPAALDAIDQPAVYAMVGPPPAGLDPMMFGGLPILPPLLGSPAANSNATDFNATAFGPGLLPFGRLTYLGGAALGDGGALYNEETLYLAPPIDELPDIDFGSDFLDGDPDENDSGSSDNPPRVIPTSDDVAGDPALIVPGSSPSDGWNPDPVEDTEVHAVPEPATVFLVGMAITGVIARRLHMSRSGRHRQR